MSEQLKFTPGPWTVRPAKYPVDGQVDYAICAKFSGAERCIAESFGRVSVDDVAPAIANAHLIAAAPDLYKALNRMVSHFSMLPPDMDQPGSVIANARAALAKAEGASDEAVQG